MLNASDTLLVGFAVSKIVLEPVDGVYSSGSSHAERKDRGRERRGEREREAGRKGGREGGREGEREIERKCHHLACTLSSFSCPKLSLTLLVVSHSFCTSLLASIISCFLSSILAACIAEWLPVTLIEALIM